MEAENLKNCLTFLGSWIWQTVNDEDGSQQQQNTVIPPVGGQQNTMLPAATPVGRPLRTFHPPGIPLGFLYCMHAYGLR